MGETLARAVFGFFGLLTFLGCEGAKAASTSLSTSISPSRGMAVILGEDETEGKPGEFVVCQCVKDGEQNFVRGLVAVVVLDGEVLGHLVDESVRIEVHEQAKEEPELGRTEDSRGRVEDAVELGDTRFLQSVPLGAFGLMLLLLPLKLASPFLGLALLLFRELLSELFGILLALGGFLFGLLLELVRVWLAVAG